MKRSSKILIPVAILVGGFLAMMGLMSLRTEAPKRAPQVRPRIVESEIVRLQTIPAKIIAYGRVSSAQPVALYSEVAGTLEEGDIPFQPAQSFKKGDLLLKIDDRQATFTLNSTKSDLLSALATVLPEIKIDFPDEYPTWQDYFDACEFGRTAPPLPEAANEKIKLYLSRFNVYKLYFSVRDLEIKLEKHNFRAPFDGSIVSADLRVGSTARSGSLLGTIINLEHLEFEAPVPAQDIPWIDIGQPVTFTSAELPGRWTGRVARVGSDIDVRTQAVQVFVELDNGRVGSMLNGVFLQAEIPGRMIDRAIAIPRKALYNERYVYVIENGKLLQRDVTIARRETDHVLVNGGIEDGDTLVIEPLQGVAPGMPAQPLGFAGEERSR